LNAAFTQSTASLDASGNLLLTADNTGPATLSLTLTDGPANVGQGNLASHLMALTTNGKDGDTTSTAIQVFDIQGTPHTLNITFTKQANNTWNMTATLPSADGTVIDGSVTGISFADDGSFQQVTGTGVGDGDIEIQFNGLAAPQTITLALGSTGGFDGLTQFGGPTTAGAIGQDGFGPGFLNNITFGGDGTVSGTFSNGRILPIAQLALANFQNPSGLVREGENYFGVSSGSGVPLIGGGQTGGRGSVQQGVLEASNVDVALEFTRLVVAQRGFQVNARILSVSNEVLQEIANIIR
jgi:flagellar hook protein FlgE